MNLALEPGAQANLLVTGSAADGTLKLSDVRMAGQGGASHAEGGGSAAEARMGVWKTVATELKGRMTSLAVHSAAPLIAAGSSHQARPSSATPAHSLVPSCLQTTRLTVTKLQEQHACCGTCALRLAGTALSMSGATGRGEGAYPSNMWAFLGLWLSGWLFAL